MKMFYFQLGGCFANFNWEGKTNLLIFSSHFLFELKANGSEVRLMGFQRYEGILGKNINRLNSTNW